MAPAPQTQPTTQSTEKAQFLKSLKPENVEPLWTVMSAMVPPKPQPRAVPTIWKYKQVRPLLEEAGRLVPAEESERRVLMLINPALKAPQTTDTLYAGLQYINPGEVAPAHRHSAFALRFIIEGDGGFTNVEGSKMYMERGDVILTPRWDWHDHGKDGSGPMIWLDGLDLPMFQAIPVNFAEHYEEDRFPSKDVDHSPMKFPWKPVQEYLDNVKGDHAIFEYRDQINNELALSTIVGAQAERIAAGTASPVRQENSSFVFHIYEGTGYTIIEEDDGKESILRWEDKDVFCVPSWKSFKHVNEGSSPAYLFNFSDTPLLKNLNIHKKA
ncbi:RmlC-like cupin domain-containing protein [Scheffersomyces xylosifermentans]|uniref:RmlC-like cupin domain-containing protein n=1 Tax=Scheffersomyces xylosifermentans TaxID=1304137 RepID=UPI00315CDB41